MTRRRFAALAFVVTVAALSAAGCAIPTQSGPSAIAPSKVPLHLLDPRLPTTTTTQPKQASYVPIKVFYLNANANNQLTPVARYVSAPAPLTSIINALLAGPSSGDAAAGLTTAIPTDVTVLSASTTAPSEVTVNLNSAFGQITGTASEQAVAQVVATVASETGANTGVIFELEGQRTSVPVANGSLVAGPVYLIDVLNVPA